MENFDITSANAAMILTVEKLFPAGINLQMFGTDQMYDAPTTDIAEARMGVDGKLVMGYIPGIQVVSFTLEAASPSLADLSQLAEAMDANKRPYLCTLVATLPAIRRRYTWSRGGLLTPQRAIPAAKTLQPTTWTFNFEKFETAGI